MVAVQVDADTYVHQWVPTTNYHTEWTSQCYTTPDVIPMMKVTLPAGPYSSIDLLITTDDLAQAPDVKVWVMSDVSWDATTVTWNTRPTLGGEQVGVIIPASTATTYRVPLDPAIMSTYAGSQVTLYLRNGGSGTSQGVKLRSIDYGGTATDPSLDIMVSSGNTRPVADAGPDQSALTGFTVTLDGTGSSDPDGTVASYAWTQTAGTTVALDDATSATPTFTAPAQATNLAFDLVVTDDDGADSLPDAVSVLVAAPQGGRFMVGDAKYLPHAVGDTPVKRAYLGDSLLWEAEQEVEPGDVLLRINAGGFGISTSGLNWAVDRSYDDPADVGGYLGSGPLTATRTNTLLPEVFHSFRLDPVGYRIPISNGCYQVRLLFAEPVSSTVAGQRVTNYCVNGQAGSVDVAAEVGPDGSVTRVVDGVTVDGGELDIRFYSETALSPVICGIEVRPGTGCPAALQSSGTDVRALITNAAAGSTVTIPRAAYTISGPIVVNKNLTVDFQGSKVTGTHMGTMLTVTGNVTATVRNVTFTHNPLPLTQGTVTVKGSNYVDVALHTGYPDASVAVNGRDSFHGHFDSSGEWKQGVMIYATSSVVNSRTIRLSNPNVLSTIAVGDKIACALRYGTEGTDAVQVITGNGDVTLDRVTVHSSRHFGFYTSRRAGIVRYRFCTLVPGPPPAGATEPQLMTTGIDGWRGQINSASIRMLGCDTSHHLDDTANWQSYPGDVIAVSGSQIDCRMVMSFNDVDRVFVPGQRLRFINKSSSAILGYRTITSVQRLSGTDFRFQTSGGTTPSVGWGMDVAEQAGNGGLITGCWLHHHTAVGVRAKSINLTVKGNRFSDLPGATFFAVPEYWDTNWTECGWTENLVIENNLFRGIPTGVRLFETGGNTYAGHSNVTIRSNRFENISGTCIDVGNTNGCIITGNTSSNSGTLVVVQGTSTNVTNEQ